MIPKVSKGSRVRGLLEYLYGPGKAEEHTDPHLVAGYDDPQVLEPDRAGSGRAMLAELSGKLDAPQLLAGERGLADYVLQISLSLSADEGQLTDEVWRRLAEQFVARMGLDGDQERAGCRWVAVRHGLSAKGNDHIHLVITRATEEGQPVWLRGEYKRAQQIAAELEAEFGLAQRCPGREGATKRPQIARADIEQARAAGRPASDRELVRRAVRAAAAAADSEEQWLHGLNEAGLMVGARVAPQEPEHVVGYTVALPPRDGRRPRWFAGAQLDGELSLGRLRARWPESAAPVAKWRKITAGKARSPKPASTPAQRLQAWESAAEALAKVNDQVAIMKPTVAELPTVAVAAADTLAQVAVIAEPHGFGAMSQAADLAYRAAAPPRFGDALPSSRIARQLGQVCMVLAAAGPARNAREAAAVMAIVVQIARLTLRLEELRRVQQRTNAAAAARVAAERMKPLLQQAANAGIRVDVEPRRSRQPTREDKTAARRRTTTAQPETYRGRSRGDEQDRGR